MSIMAESNVYESMADDGLNEKLCLAACETSGAFMFIPKIERQVEAMCGVSKEIMEEKTGILHDGIIQDTYDSIGESTVYFEEAFSACEEVEVDYKPSLGSMMLPVEKMEDQWTESNQFESSAMDSSFDAINVSMSYRDESDNVDDSDEETIATFLTSAGQRLALYAVENSDEVFAVAVYDESGEPPTNFQFLMKSDVERLIGEGAVRTVKKPTQMKKQLFSTDPPVFAQHTEEPCSVETPQLKTEPVKPTQYQNNQYDTHKTTWNDDTNLSSTEIVQETERQSSPSPDADTQPHFTYVLMEDTCPALDRIEERHEAAEVPAECVHDEFIEQSTVQYILLGEDDSDSELTLADIEETLKNYKTNDKKKSLLKKTLRTNVESTEEDHGFNGMLTLEATRDDLQDVDIPANIEDYTGNCLSSPNKSYKNANSTRKAASSLSCTRENFIDERLNVSSCTSLLIANSEAKSSEEPSAPLETVQISSRVKRSRKQQLTSVNRDDSEIIIQPASFPSEENEPTKKRGRGKRKPGRPAVYKAKATVAKKLRRSQRPRPVEVIEIDVDEDDRLQGKKDIVEITIDGNKEKGSSDKENEVIMVGDSEDEAQEAGTSKSSTSILKCNHCLRSFRQKRALQTHSRVCPKSPNYVRRIIAKSARRTSIKSNDSPAVKKQYPCKICQEKFDVVVALARHVRSMHSQRKKLNSNIQTTAPAKPPESPAKIEETPKKSQLSESVTSVRPRKKTKTRIKASNRSWKSNKLHCADCGRWFSSDALLIAHSLQHATKKSEKQTRRCQTCKKIFKSRLLYIRHVKMHSRVKQLQKKLHHTRQTTSKTTALRKRGRPRKL